MKRFALLMVSVLLLLITTTVPTWAIGEEKKGDIPDAQIRNDEGGPVVIHGEVSYTDPLFTKGVSEPLIILEDETGFINRDKGYLIPVASQQLGQITSDFYHSPFTYSLSLPIEPQAPLHDLDHDNIQDTGVMVFQIAYWTNTFGDAFLEQRDLFGGGWSTAYSSAEVSNEAANQGEFVGGKIVIYAPVKGQAFPSGFGDDGKLFTDDDPLVIVPQGYTIVDMNSKVFKFDRSREPNIDLLEGKGAGIDDFSKLSYTESFNSMVDKMRREYAFTDFKHINWDSLYTEFSPAIQQAETNSDSDLFATTLQQFLWQIPDGHIGMQLTLPTYEQFSYDVDGGLGMAIRQLDDGRVIVNYITDGGPAAKAGIELRAEVTAINGNAIEDALNNTLVWSAPFSTDHVRRLQQLRYVTRYPIGTQVKVTFKNPDSNEQTVTLTAVNELASFKFSSFNVARTGYENPVEVKVEKPYLVISINSFFDDNRLSIQLWERILRQAIAEDVPGIILDMRNNGGGAGFIANQMAAYFFDTVQNPGNTGHYDESRGSFYFNTDHNQTFFLPPQELRYSGKVVVLVGPNCASACEFFSYDMTLSNRATIIGQYPTAGLGGSIEEFRMPDNITIQMTTGRAVDANGNIHIEGKGVVPDIRVPVTEETLFADYDVVLQAAVDYLNQTLGLK